MKKHSIACLMLFLAWSAINEQVVAADDIVLRSMLIPEEAWVGQKVVLSVDVLAKDGWAQLRRVADIEVDGAYLLDLESQGTRLNETIDGDSYTGQRYSFMLFAQRAGRISIPPVPVDVEIKTWGVDGGSRIVRKIVPAVEFVARIPAGVKDAYALITTGNFTATQTWEPETGTAMVGDAIRRRIELYAEDVSGMAFPPSLHDDIDDVGIYPGEPTVEDKFNRGELAGTRIETVTYVFERAGQFEIPDIELLWWNIDTEELQQIVLPGLSLEVTGGMAEEVTTFVAEQPQDKPFLRLSLAAIILVVIALLASGDRIGVGWKGWRRARNETEAAYFRRIRRSAQLGDPAAVLRDTMCWLDRINESTKPARLDLFLRQYGDPGVAEAIIDARKSGIGTFLRRLTMARHRWRRAQRDDGRARDLLPNLNNPGNL